MVAHTIRANLAKCHFAYTLGGGIERTRQISARDFDELSFHFLRFLFYTQFLITPKQSFFKLLQNLLERRIAKLVLIDVLLIHFIVYLIIWNAQ